MPKNQQQQHIIEQLSNLKQNLNKTKRNQVATVKKLIEFLQQLNWNKEEALYVT